MITNRFIFGYIHIELISKSTYRRWILIVCGMIALYFLFNGVVIYRYAAHYYEDKSDVAIVLGAGTSNGQLSPVFRERVNHSIYLYDKGLVDYVILTGGMGKGQEFADSEIASAYFLKQGVPEEVILIEKESRFTIENLENASILMDSLQLTSALLVSDPLHMKRSMALAQRFQINCKPSPTRTSMYRSFIPKGKSLIYETFYFSIGEIIRAH